MVNHMKIMNEKDIIHYLEGGDDQELFREAERIKNVIFGSEVYLRGIVEFSNVCNKKCLYCGLRAPNSKVVRYRLGADAILAAVSIIPECGLGTVVLQSGDDFHYSREMIGRLVAAVKARHDVAVTLSLGDRGHDEFVYWKECGADRYLIKLETTDSKFYDKFRSGESLEDRLARIGKLHELGYEVGSGVIVGLPGVGIDQLARDIMGLTELDLEMIAVGPFIPHPQTPLGLERPGRIELSYRTSALLRIMNPTANIPATSALDSLAPDGRELGLVRGCNVLMPSVTPDDVKADYYIYPGKNAFADNAGKNLAAIKKRIVSRGLVPSSSKGFSPRRKYVEQSA